MAFIILFQIRQIVNEHTSAESQKTVDSILDQVWTLHRVICKLDSSILSFFLGGQINSSRQATTVPEATQWAAKWYWPSPSAP